MSETSFKIGTKFRVYLKNGFYYDNEIVDYYFCDYRGKLYVAKHLEHEHLNFFTHEQILDSVILNKDLSIEKVLKDDCNKNEYIQMQLF